MFKRILTAIVLIAAVAAILLWVPVIGFQFLILLLVLGSLKELYRLIMPNDNFSLITGLCFGLIFSVMLIFSIGMDFILPIGLSAFFILLLLHMAYFTTVEHVVNRIGLILFGTIYLSFTLPAFVWLREASYGRSLIVFTLAIVAVADSFAFGAGKLFGKHKMSPLISPNKTYEGLIGSFVGGVFASVVCWQIFWPELSALLVVILGIVVAFIGAMGDLVESLIKRGCHIKDSGNLLPGHGGILDRIDALVFAAPFVYFLFKFLGKI